MSAICASNWLLAGPLPIPGICEIVAAYTQRLTGVLQGDYAISGSPVLAMCLLPSMSKLHQIVVSSDDGRVQVVDTAGARARKFEGHTGAVLALTVLDGGKVVSGSWDKTVRVWDADSGECLLKLEGHTGSVSSLAVLPDGRLATGSGDRTIRVWDVSSGTCVLVLAGHTQSIASLAALPDDRLASGDQFNRAA